jgi:ribonuclease HI
LEAAIMGLASVLKYVSAEVGFKLGGTELPEVTLVSDSQIILGWANGKNRFKQKTKMNKYYALQHLVKRLEAKTRWVEGHSGDVHNSRCDRLASWARKGIAEPPPPGKPRRSMKEISKDIEENNKKRPYPKISLIGKKKVGTMSFWYKGILKIVDLDKNIVENYDKDIHGNRKSHMELRINENE